MRFLSALRHASRFAPRDLGRAGETKGVWFYRWRGYSIVERNFRLNDGEIDLIVRRGRTVAFVEIKTRQTKERGAPYEAVNRAKQLQIARLAERFLAMREMQGVTTVRFDVLSVFWNGKRFEIEWFPSAFELMADPARPWKSR